MQKKDSKLLKNKMINDKFKFYSILCIELVLYPFLWLWQWFIRSRRSSIKPDILRSAIESHKIIVCIHEWGGYPMKRNKRIKKGVSFECGLKYQLDRFSEKENVDLIVTVSDISKHACLESIQSQAKVFEVDNRGMDFSGYAFVYEMVKNKPNQYIILSNSSVNAIQNEFLQEYIDYMELNPDVGLLGISYCTKMIQTLIRNNFTPHLQSFFILTTIGVLKEIVKENKGKFPGVGIAYKLLLIREGEILLSKLALKLGYSLAIVQDNGKVFKFNKGTSYNDWNIPKGDVRQYLNEPNKINAIQ